MAFDAFDAFDALFSGMSRLQNESRRACPELVERGRLNLAQDAVLGSDSSDEKSRRDDWKLPDKFFSRPCGTFRWRLPTQDCVLG